MINIRVEELQHTYRSKQQGGQGMEPRTVLTIPKWTVAAGDHLLLKGISGSGKTTLLNVLAGLQPPTTGRVWLNDDLLYALSEAKRDQLRARYIGYVFQIHLLVPTLTALENVEMPLVFAGKLRGKQRRERAAELLTEVGLGDFLRHRPVQLSVGQRLRVSIARALVNHPALLLADEPTAALDVEAGRQVMELMQQVCRTTQTTLIVASHDPALTARFEQIITLQNGAIVHDV